MVGATQAADRGSIAWFRPLAFKRKRPFFIILHKHKPIDGEIPTMRVEFVVNNTPKFFYAWLRELTKEQSYAGSLQFPFGRDSVHLQPATIEPNGDPHSPVVRLSLRSHRLIRGDDGLTVTAIGGFSGTETIIFKLVPLDDRRTDVTATCGVPLILPYFRQLLLTIGRKYPETVTAIELQMDKTERRQTDWQASFADGVASAPWEGFLPLSLKDVDAACHEHLEYLSGKRFSAEWDVHVRRYVEREGIAVRYDVQSAGRMAGHFRIRWIDPQQTHVEVIASKYGDDNDLHRLRGVMAIFAARWLSEIPHEVLTPELSLKPTLPANMSRDGWEFVNLNSTAGTMSPGMYAVTRSQAKAIGVVNAAIDILKDQFESKLATQPTGDDETSQKADRESPTVNKDDEHLNPIVLNWSVSKLKRWFNDFSDDNGLHLVVFHSPAKGYLDIYKDPFSQVGIKCEPEVDGKIRLTPYVLDGATAEAVEELRQWHDSLILVIEDDALAPIISTASQDMDEDEKLALLAKQYSVKLNRKLRPTTIRTWLLIAEHRRRDVNGVVVLLTDAQVIERTGINQETYNTHKSRMKKSGFWKDYELDQE